MLECVKCGTRFEETIDCRSLKGPLCEKHRQLCPECLGEGIVEGPPEPDGFGGLISTVVECPVCGGTGIVSTENVDGKESPSRESQSGSTVDSTESEDYEESYIESYQEGYRE
jgi:DnaJ-class molecular chaperone